MRFICDKSYEEDLKLYTEQVLKKSGLSQAAERETMSMADNPDAHSGKSRNGCGNVVAEKLYGDLVFYKKIIRQYPYRDAFDLYLRSARIKIDEDGKWTCNGDGYPLAFWSLGYYLFNYRSGTFLQKCEKIEAIEKMSLNERLAMALALSAACMEYINSAGAMNLIGRIMLEASQSQEVFEALSSVIKEDIEDRFFAGISLKTPVCNTPEECVTISNEFFAAAAREGYVYACNNMAAGEAEKIVRCAKAGEKVESEMIDRYIGFLRRSADKYEPYAANRLGLFFLTGEIKSGDERYVSREYVDFTKAKEYLKKATLYPDSNSAWAFFNLIKYFPKDYEADIELLNEHMDYIKRLNKEVYNIAIEL